MHETNEDSPSDSPYFLVYAGDKQNQRSDVPRVRRQSWDDDVDAGDPTRTATGSTSNSLVKNLDVILVALIEEDFGPDANLELNVRNKMNDIDTILDSISSNDLKVNFRFWIKKNLVNDDFVNVQEFSNNVWTFLSGDEAIYRVKFVH